MITVVCNGNVVKTESREDAANRLRQIADKLENDEAVDIDCFYLLDANAEWRLTTNWGRVK